MLDQLLSYFQGGALTLWGPFLLLLLCGLGLPVPEDIILIAAGILSVEYHHSLWITIVVMYVGILAGDLLIYAVGRSLGRKALGSRVGRMFLAPEKIPKVEEMFRKYGSGVIFVGRFLPGLRAPIYFTSGTLSFPILKFVVFDGFAALISAPFFVWFGSWAWETYAADQDQLFKGVAQFKAVLIPAVVVIGVGIFFYIRRRHRRKENTTEAL